MKNLSILFLLIFTFISCKKNNKTTSADNNLPPIEKEEIKTPTPEEIEIDDTLILSEEISDFLNEKMPNFEIVPKDKWLSEEYLESMSKSMRPLYKDDILVEGDFNGDGENDFATFLMDKKGRIKLYAFHKTASGYKKYELQKEASEGYLGAGLDVEEPGFIYGGNKEVGLEYNGIIYNVYEKTGTTFYYDAGRYKKVLTND